MNNNDEYNNADAEEDQSDDDIEDGKMILISFLFRYV